MTRETLGRFLIAASTTIAMSCGISSGPAATVQSPNPSPPVAAQIGPLVLSEKGCTYAGPAQVGSGAVALKMTNETKLQFSLDLYRVSVGHTYAELDAHIKEEQRRAATGEPGLGHPSFAALIDQESVAPGSETKNISTLAPGTYGFVCIAFEIGGQRAAIWLAGPLSVAT